MQLIKKITDFDIIGKEGFSNKKPKLSARAILIDENYAVAILYVKKKNAYTIPGGGIEKHETILEGLKREIMEETGCQCKVLGEIGAIYENRAQHDFTHLNYYYLARVIGKKGNPQYTENELKNKNEVMWIELCDVHRIIGSQIPESYQFQFIKERDITILNFLFNAPNLKYKTFIENLCVCSEK